MVSTTDATPYGEWQSPIDAADVARLQTPLEVVAIDGGRALWAERRADEEGRTVVVAHDGATITDVVDDTANVRSTAHEYGGGAVAVRDGQIWYCNYSDQRVYRRVGDAEAVAITPEGPRYADLQAPAHSQELYAVRERHDGDGVERDIVALSWDGSGEPRVLTTGHDFYSSPRLSPDGKQLAWVSWDHPDMPWDATQLWVADLGPDQTLGRLRLVAGGENESVQQPLWHTDGSLWFVNDPDGWWNLYRLTPGGDVEAMTTDQVEYGWPAWQFGLQTYGFLTDGRVVAIANESGVQRVVTFIPGKSPTKESLPFSAIKPKLITDGRNVLVVAGTPSEPMAVVRWDASTGDVSTLRRESTFDLHPDDMSVPRAIEFPTTGGKTAHAFFYAPRNAGAGVVSRGDTVVGELPPLVVMSHGGPTSQSPASFSLATQFWTTRGFAVVDVNYGGSTGYGRPYRERLNGNWGIVDVDDCVNAARFLANSKLVDRERMAIRGGSAGGFTTMSALTFHDDFAAGASYFGVADIKSLAEHTHDFESRYMDRLVGTLPEQEEVYLARSPIHHTDQLTTPIILFQGLEDAVVPPEQSEALARALTERGVPHKYVTYEGEQHGFRRAKTIIHALESELAFYGQIMRFSPAGVQPLQLDGKA